MVSREGAIIVGELVHVHEGQAVRVRGKGGNEYDLFVMDPEPYREHVGKTLALMWSSNPLDGMALVPMDELP